MPAFSDLIVVIPGILGSRLIRRDGRRTQVVWDLSIRNLPRLLHAAATDQLVVDENDGIEADALFNYQLLPGFFGVDDYDSLIAVLRAITADPSQVILHPYDWRKSNRLAAESLSRKINDGLKRLKDQGAEQPKAWLIAHSMGGLVARYFCEQLGGAPRTRAVITVGTPHRGSVKALDALVNGKRYGPLVLTPFLRSMPSIYELLPLFPVLRTRNGAERGLLRIAETFGLDAITGDDTVDLQGRPTPTSPHQIPHLKRDMVQEALRFHAGIRLPAEAREIDPPYRQRVIFNRSQHTPHSVAIHEDGVAIYTTYPNFENGRWSEDDARGDGTVPAQSAVPIEWTDTADAVPNAEKHTGLQGTREAQDAITNWLLPAAAQKFKGSGDERDMIVLDVPPVVENGTTFPVALSAGRGMFATITIASPETQPSARQVPVTADARTIELGPLDPGVHRITVQPLDLSKPSVSDYVYVTGAEVGATNQTIDTRLAQASD